MEIIFTDAENKIIQNLRSQYICGDFQQETKAYALLMCMSGRSAVQTSALIKLIATLPQQEIDDILFVNKRSIKALFEKSAPLTRALGVYSRNYGGFPSWRINPNLEIIMYIGVGADDRSVSPIRKRDLQLLMKTFKPLIKADRNPEKANVACGVCGCGKPTMMDQCPICGNRGI